MPRTTARTAWRTRRSRRCAAEGCHRLPMASSSQIRRLATNPAAHVRFLTTGRLPQRLRPQGPLFDLLSRIAAHDRVSILGVVVDARLGYVGSREFRNAEAAYRWIAPAPEMVEGEPWPAEAARIKGFGGQLNLDDLVACAAHCPAELMQAYGSLRRPSSAETGEHSTPRPRR